MTNTKEETKQIDTVDIHGKNHPTYAGVLNKAHEGGLVSIQTKLIQAPLQDNHFMAIMHATVTMRDKKVFEGIGDATPKNVNSMIAPHIVRMAETRAKGRALRDALNITEALAEEMGGDNAPVRETVSMEGGTVSTPQRTTAKVQGGAVSETVRMCPNHNVPFERKEGKYGVFYSHKDGDDWCNEKNPNPKVVQVDAPGTPSKAGHVDVMSPDIDLDAIDRELS